MPSSVERADRDTPDLAVTRPAEKPEAQITPITFAGGVSDNCLTLRFDPSVRRSASAHEDVELGDRRSTLQITQAIDLGTVDEAP